MKFSSCLMAIDHGGRYLMTDFTNNIPFLIAPVLNTLPMSILHMTWPSLEIYIYIYMYYLTKGAKGRANQVQTIRTKLANIKHIHDKSCHQPTKKCIKLKSNLPDCFLLKHKNLSTLQQRFLTHLIICQNEDNNYCTISSIHISVTIQR